MATDRIPIPAHLAPHRVLHANLALGLALEYVHAVSQLRHDRATSTPPQFERPDAPTAWTTDDLRSAIRRFGFDLTPIPQ